MLRSFFIFLTHATPTLFPDPQSPAVSQVPSQVKFPAMNRHRRMAYIAGTELAILLSDLLLQANRFLFEDPLIKEILWLPGSSLTRQQRQRVRLEAPIGGARP